MILLRMLKVATQNSKKASEEAITMKERNYKNRKIPRFWKSAGMKSYSCPISQNHLGYFG